MVGRIYFDDITTIIMSMVRIQGKWDLFVSLAKAQLFEECAQHAYLSKLLTSNFCLNSGWPTIPKNK